MSKVFFRFQGVDVFTLDNKERETQKQTCDTHTNFKRNYLCYIINMIKGDICNKVVHIQAEYSI